MNNTKQDLAMENAAPQDASSETMIDMIMINKWYGNFHVLKNSSLTVKKGERIVICGPSGSGNSTLFRCINRFECRQEGQVVEENDPHTFFDKPQIDRTQKFLANIL